MPSRRFPSPVRVSAWIEQGGRLKKTLAAAPPTWRGEATPEWRMHVMGGGECREGERTMCRNGLVRFQLIPIDGTYKGKIVRTEVMSCPQGDRGAPLGCVLQFKMFFFVRAYFRIFYFIITYLLCLFSILFGSSVISTEIQMT